MARPFLSVIIPTENDANILPLTLVDVDRHLARAEYAYEIVAVNDGSTDGTATMLERIAPYVAHMKYLHTIARRGEGNAIAAGMVAARGTWRLVVRADNAVSVLEFEKFMPVIMERRADVIVGSRRVRGGREQGTAFMRRRSEDGLAFLARRLFRLPLRDPFSGFLCMSTEAAGVAYNEPLVRGPGHIVQSLHRVRQAGLQIREVPISARYAGQGSRPPRGGLRMFADLITIRLRHMKRAAESASPRNPQVSNPN